MKTAIVTIKGENQISFSKRHDAPMYEGENRDAHDERTWREHLHYDEKSLECYIPGIQLKLALDWTASQLGLKVEGRGNKTWATIFRSGVMCPDRVMLGIKRDDVQSVKIRANSRGKRGGSLDITRRYPVIAPWSGVAQFYVFDDTINERIFALHLDRAGKLCGVGRFSPRNGGFLGRFEVAEMLWQDEAELAQAA